MKHILLVILAIFGIFVNAQRLNAYFNQSVFWSPTEGEYSEIYFTFVGESTTFVKNNSGKFNSDLQILITYSQNKEIKQFRKYNLKSPEISDTSKFISNFVDIQRLSIKPGNYKFVIKIKDNNDSTNFLEYSDSVSIGKIEGTSFSNIEFLESIEKSANHNKFYKSGYNIVPYVSDYYPSNINSFNFYTELYFLASTIKTNDDFLIKYFIEPYNNSKYKLGSYTKIERRKASQINVVMGSFNIDKLPSGNYNFVVECISKNNELVAFKKVFFQRNNRIVDKQLGNVDSIKIEDTFIDNQTNIDTLTDFIKCLFPIMESKQINHSINQLKAKNIIWMQKFFYGFWYEKSSFAPEEAWLKYKSKVNYVNKQFSSQIKRGYETDRGRIYLKYGPPKNVIKRLQPVDSYPYEMWHYIKTPTQGNVKIVFYNPNMIRGDYILLYTNLVGESSDPNWQSIIIKTQNNSRNYGNTVIDDFRSL